jgi:dTMP kinase
MGELATGGLEPDVTVILDVDAAMGLSRVGGEPDRMEARAREFHEAVRAGYHAIAKEGRMRAVLVPPGDLEAVARGVEEAVRHVL